MNISVHEHNYDNTNKILSKNGLYFQSKYASEQPEISKVSSTTRMQV